MAKRLGKGLGALIQDMEEESGSGVREVGVEQIVPNPEQPRKHFDAEKLQELADSIGQHGIIQPLTVKQQGEAFVIIAGERRWRAAKLAGLTKVPVFLLEVPEEDKLELALIENLQRDDLSPMEEAYAYKALIEGHSYTQEVLGRRLGKSRPHIANTLRLLALPQVIQEAVDQGKISAGHARALLMAGDKELMLATFQRILDRGISVRETESICCQSINQENEEKPTRRGRREASVFERDAMNRIQEFLGTGVRINRTEKKGVVEVDFYSDEDLLRLCDLILGES